MSDSLTVIEKIRDQLRGLAALDDEQVIVGAVLPIEKIDRLHVGVMPKRESSEWEDGNDIECTLQLVVACIIPVDPLDTDSDFKKLTSTWSSVEAELEKLIKNNCDGQCNRFEQTAEGVEWGGLSDRDNLTYVGAAYRATFSRTLAT